MPGKITQEEVAIRHQMSTTYKGQEASADGFDDWGEYTAHVIYLHRKEIYRLQQLLESKELNPGSWADPFET